MTDQYPHGTSKAAAYADYLTAVGTVKGYYFPHATKSWLIVKVNTENKTEDIFCSSTKTLLQINTIRKRQLGASLESDNYKNH